MMSSPQRSLPGTPGSSSARQVRLPCRIVRIQKAVRDLSDQVSMEYPFFGPEKPRKASQVMGTTDLYVAC